MKPNKKAKSTIWNNFNYPEENEKLFDDVAICKKCFKGILVKNPSGVKTGTKNLISHTDQCSVNQVNMPKIELYSASKKSLSDADKMSLKDCQTKFVILQLFCHIGLGV